MHISNKAVIGACTIKESNDDRDANTGFINSIFTRCLTKMGSQSGMGLWSIGINWNNFNCLFNFGFDWPNTVGLLNCMKRSVIRKGFQI